jgi:hypothetical protein
MGYYSMPLLEESKELCTVSLLCGLYQYNTLAQGIIIATNIFQARMSALFCDEKLNAS